MHCLAGKGPSRATAAFCDKAKIDEQLKVLPNTPDGKGRLVLYSAVEAHDIRIARRITRHTRIPEPIRPPGKTAPILHCGVQAHPDNSKVLEMEQLLLGSDVGQSIHVDDKDEKQSTALNIALERPSMHAGRWNLIHELLQAAERQGCDLTMVNATVSVGRAFARAAKEGAITSLTDAALLSAHLRPLRLHGPSPFFHSVFTHTQFHTPRRAQCNSAMLVQEAPPWADADISGRKSTPYQACKSCSSTVLQVLALGMPKRPNRRILS